MDSDLRGVNVFLTGATGFIGSHLAEALVKAGANVKCLVRDISKIEWLLGLDVTLVKGDITDINTYNYSLKDIDIIYHVAGLGLSRMKSNMDLNVNAAKALAEACRLNPHIKTVIFLSTIKAVRPCINGIPINEDTSPKPTDFYGKSKYICENILKSSLSKTKLIIVRPPAVFGPRDKNFLTIFKMINKGICIMLFNNGGAKFSLVYVKDLVEGLIQLSIKHSNYEEKSEVIFISSSDILSFNKFISILKLVSNKKVINIPLFSIPTYFIAKIITKILGIFKLNDLPSPRIDDLFKYDWVCTTGKAKSKYGIVCGTTHKQALTETWEWYKKAGWV